MMAFRAHRKPQVEFFGGYGSPIYPREKEGLNRPVFRFRKMHHRHRAWELSWAFIIDASLGLKESPGEAYYAFRG